MKRILSGLLSLFLITSALFLTSCENQAQAPADTSATTDTTVSDTAKGAPETEEPPAYEENPTFTVCGHDLSEYKVYACFPYAEKENEEALFVRDFDNLCESSLGYTLPYEIKTSNYYLKQAIPEEGGKTMIFVPFTTGFETIPEFRGETCYGVNDDGVIYFCCACPDMYIFLFRLFLEDNMGIPRYSGEKARKSCDLSAYNKIPTPFTDDDLKAYGYSLSFEENFDEDTINRDIWKTRGAGARSGGYSISSSQESVSDGIFSITAEYLENGEFGKGWYTSNLSLKKWYCRGYFEAKIQPNEYKNFWTAFWIQGPNPYKPEASKGGAGEGGAELDILEFFGDDQNDCNIYCAGGADPTSEALDTFHFSYPSAPEGDTFTDEYHTYGLMWDEHAYIFTFDGVPYVYSEHYSGTSSVPEEVIFSLCKADPMVEEDRNDKRVARFDWLKIWQTPEDSAKNIEK